MMYNLNIINRVAGWVRIKIGRNESDILNHHWYSNTAMKLLLLHGSAWELSSLQDAG